MKQLTVVAVFFFTAIIPSLANGIPSQKVVPSMLKSAIVYRSGAELFHSAKVTLVAGNNEFVIDGISNKIELSSVRISADNNLTVMAAEFGLNFLQSGAPSPELKIVLDSMESSGKELTSLQSDIATNRELQTVLEANKSIAGSQNGVSVQELMKLMDYYKLKKTELQKELDLLKAKELKLLKLVGNLEKQKASVEKQNVNTTGQLQIRAFVPVGGTYTLSISYITPLASWNPAYDLRVESITKPINIGFKARLTQTSGLDWKHVKLVLATSMPNLNATAPELQSWILSLPELSVVRYNMRKEIAPQQDALQEVVVRGVATTGSASGSVKSYEAPDPVYVLNGNIISKDEFGQINKRAIKSVNVLKGNNATALYGSRAAGGAILVTLKEGIEDYLNESDNELNVTYEIDLPYDVPTNGKEQVVALKDRVVEASYKFYTAPVKDKDAYLLGCIPDWGSLQLLAGEANIIFEGSYVGKTYINPSSTNDTLNLTLGKDKRVVVTREKLKDFSSVKFLNSKKLHTFTYEITIKNNKKEAIQLQVKDLFPIPTDKEIEVELLEFSGADVDKEKSFLTWNLELKPGEAKKVRMSYSVKYPKEKNIAL